MFFAESHVQIMRTNMVSFNLACATVRFRASPGRGPWPPFNNKMSSSRPRRAFKGSAVQLEAGLEELRGALHTLREGRHVAAITRAQLPSLQHRVGGARECCECLCSISA